MGCLKLSTLTNEHALLCRVETMQPVNNVLIKYFLCLNYQHWVSYTDVVDPDTYRLLLVRGRQGGGFFRTVSVFLNNKMVSCSLALVLLILEVNHRNIQCFRIPVAELKIPAKIFGLKFCRLARNFSTANCEEYGSFFYHLN